MNLIDLLKRSDADPPVRRGAPLSPRGRAELRSLVGPAADQGLKRRAARGSGRLPQLLSVGLTALVVVVGGVGLALWPRESEVQTPVQSSGSSATVAATPTHSASPTPSAASTAEPSPSAAPSEQAAAQSQPAVAPSQPGTGSGGSGGTGGSGATGTSGTVVVDSGPSQAAPPAPSVNAPSKAAAPATSPAPAPTSAPASPRWVPTAADLQGSWKVSYYGGVWASDGHVLIIGSDHVTLASECAEAGSTAYVAANSGAWSFSDGPVDASAWTCSTEPRQPGTIDGAIFASLSQATRWSMDSANRVTMTDSSGNIKIVLDRT
ncbi:MAG: hypothetical protein LBR33_06690 [Propionibacteriaceae bacterium]|jgi:hypothetical protein|nr:hypothetical protein [Propionibacteriaceae bacterium]